MKKIERLERVDIDLSSHQRDLEKFEQENNSIALICIIQQWRDKTWIQIEL